MSVHVPLIGDPRGQLIEALPFVHTCARDQCHRAIRRVFGATAKQENVQIMLNLGTPNGPTLLAMVANIVHHEPSAVIILSGREMDSGLVGLLHTSESVTESDGGIRGQLDCGSSEADVSSITGPSDSPSLVGGRGGGGDHGVDISNSATSRSVGEERIGPQGAGTLDHHQEQYEARGLVLRLQQNRAEDQLHWDSDPAESVRRFRESRRVRVGFSDTTSMDSNLQHIRLRRRNDRANERRRCALQAACCKLRAAGAFMRNGQNKTKRMLAMWLRRNENMNLDVMRLLGEYCWRDGWRGVAGCGDHTRNAAVEADAAAAAAGTHLAAFRLGDVAAVAAEAEAQAESARELVALELASGAIGR